MNFTEYRPTAAMTQLRERLRPKTPEEIRQWAEAEPEDRNFRRRKWIEHIRRQRLAKSHQLIKKQNEDGTTDYY